jgi:hypothetical protein
MDAHIAPRGIHVSIRLRIAAAVCIAVAVVVFMIASDADPAFAQDELEGVTTLEAIMGRIKTWIQVLAGSFCVVMVCVAGARYLASSNPTGSERAKSALMAAAIGLGIVLLADPLVSILTWFVNGSSE